MGALLLFADLHTFFADSCYIQDNAFLEGFSDYEKANVASMNECRNICKDRKIRSFVWIKLNHNCFCKETDSAPVIDPHAVSGGVMCVGELRKCICICIVCLFYHDWEWPTPS